LKNLSQNLKISLHNLLSNKSVDNFKKAAQLLTAIGCKRKSYQETKRELWLLGEVEITIDEWPFLEPLVEIEGKSEKAVEKICNKLSLDYGKALFCSITTLYNKKYGCAKLSSISAEGG